MQFPCIIASITATFFATTLRHHPPVFHPIVPPPPPPKQPILLWFKSSILIATPNHVHSFCHLSNHRACRCRTA